MPVNLLAQVIFAKSSSFLVIFQVIWRENEYHYRKNTRDKNKTSMQLNSVCRQKISPLTRYLNYKISSDSVNLSLREMYFLFSMVIIVCSANPNLKTSHLFNSEINSGNQQYLSSLNIDESLNQLQQDDSRLISVIREQYLIPPSTLPYNFTNNKLDLKGEFGQANFVYKHFFRYWFLTYYFKGYVYF